MSIFDNDTAEANLIALLLSDPKAWPLVRHMKADMFLNPGYGQAWRVIEAKDGNITVDSLVNDLGHIFAPGHNETILEYLGGAKAIRTLAATAPSLSSVNAVTEAVLECYTNRQIRTLADVIRQSISPKQEHVSAAERLELIQHKFNDISVHPGQASNTFSEGIDSFWKRAEYYFSNPGKIPGLKLGWPDLDGMLQGLEPGDLLVIASNPGEGKSMLVGEIARNITTMPQDDGKKRRAMFFGVEMSAEQMAWRFASAYSRVSAEDIRMKGGTPEQRAALAKAKTWLLTEMAPNFLYYGPGKFQNIRDISHIASYMLHQEQVDLIVVDYIQRVSTERRDKRTEEIADITSKLKYLAGELKVPVIAVSQVTRETGKENSGRAGLFDLAESAALERDADYVMSLWCPARHLEKATVRKYWQNVAVVELLKGRFRKTNKCYLRFDGSCARFDSLSKADIAILNSPDRQDDLKPSYRKKKDD